MAKKKSPAGRARATRAPASREDLIQIVSSSGRYSIMIENDEDVVWAYLLDDGHIVGDVWLCNRVAEPDNLRRHEDGKAPGNASGHYDESRTIPELTLEGVTARFVGDAADLFVGETWVAQLRAGAKPGWSILSLKPNAVAQPLGQTTRLSRFQRTDRLRSMKKND